MIYTKTIPKKWEEEDIKKLLNYKKLKLSNKEIADKLGRTEISIQIKLKRLAKNDKTYNKGHIIEKRNINNKFIDYIKPKTILDLYSGEFNDNYSNVIITTNDKNKNYKTDYNEDALKLLCKLYYENKKYDVIDLDPFGSAYDNFDLAIKMAKKGIMITLGELGHKRWKRLDYVKNRYNINSLEEFTIDNIIKEIKKIGLQNKKELIVYEKKEWKNIGRVWFIIKPIKITEQWEEKE